MRKWAFIPNVMLRGKIMSKLDFRNRPFEFSMPHAQWTARKHRSENKTLKYVLNIQKNEEKE